MRPTNDLVFIYLLFLILFTSMLILQIFVLNVFHVNIPTYLTIAYHPLLLYMQATHLSLDFPQDSGGQEEWLT